MGGGGVLIMKIIRYGPIWGSPSVGLRIYYLFWLETEHPKNLGSLFGYSRARTLGTPELWKLPKEELHYTKGRLGGRTLKGSLA